MKTSLENKNFDTMLEPSDWRFSAAIYGIIQYFDYHGIEYEIDDDAILYNQGDITEEKYLEFIENKYGEKLHHKLIENILIGSEFSDDQIKLVNEKLKANTIMKKVFGKTKFDGNNKELILNLLNENRNTLIKETFRTKKDMYADYANTNQLLNDEQSICRLLGYYIDSGKKGKSIGYNFVMNNFVSQDIKEFDFIPFAFSGDREAFFINDNVNIDRLKITNKILEKSLKVEDDRIKNSRQAFFKAIIESSDFIKRDIEVIVKSIDKDFFETLYIRKKSIDILHEIAKNNVDYEALNISFKVTTDFYRNIQREVMDNILNNIYLDDLIELFLKEKRAYIVSQLIKINVFMRGERDMKDKLKGAYACAKQVAGQLESNKIESYRQKLTSAVIFKDYDRACQILLQLSNYSSIEFGFVYDLFDSFEDNKDLIYTFINALSKDTGKSKKENN